MYASNDRSADAPRGGDLEKPKRLYAVAKEVGMSNQELLTKVRELGIQVKNHMSSIEPEDIVRVVRAVRRERVENTVSERISPTVIRRRSKVTKAVAAPQVTPEPAVEPVPEPAAPSEEELAAKDREREREARAAQETREAEERRAAKEAAAAEKARLALAAKEAAKKAKAEAKAAAEHDLDPEPEPDRAPEPEPKPAARQVKPREAVNVTGRSAFEDQLSRARERTVARQAATMKKQDDGTPQVPSDGRPAVGSVIDLAPRIQITERLVPRATTTGARGKWAQQQRGGGRRRDAQRRGQTLRKPGKQTQITTPAEHKRVIKVEETIAVGELAKAMGTKSNDVLRKLWSMGMVGITINQTVDAETATLLANEFGYDVQNVAFQEDEMLYEIEDQPEDMVTRAPIVTVMGHVDHGKTSLLDVIRNANVVSGESGGITQHIGAYRVTTKKAGELVFLDTPGHAAFTAMRARGAQLTDAVILVVAADDGVMPQTIEAVNHAKDAGVPVVVAVNKMDRPNANPERVRQQLAEHGLSPEEWGGETIFVNVSAHTKEGIDDLLEAVHLQAQMLELQVNPNKAARGIVVEAKLDRSRGPMATVLVQEGTLHVGDTVVAGEFMGKIRAMLNDRGSNVKEVGPATPVEVFGLDGVPGAGESINSVSDEKAAKNIMEHRRDSRRNRVLAASSKLSLENIFEKIQEGQTKELKIVLKADVQGSAEALKAALIQESTEKVRVNVISAGVGGITESDVNLAKAGGAIIVGFHVRPAGKALQLSEKEGVSIELYSVIYEAIDDVKRSMVGLLAPIRKERAMGSAEVLQTFTIPKLGTIAGCQVNSGKITRQAHIRLVRDSVQLYEGRLASLKRFKDDAREVAEGYECGTSIDGYNDIRVGDVIEAYEIYEEAPTL